jgi:hypothetical protein
VVGGYLDGLGGHLNGGNGYLGHDAFQVRGFSEGFTTRRSRIRPFLVGLGLGRVGG